jgi:hypothetical protein
MNLECLIREKVDNHYHWWISVQTDLSDLRSAVDRDQVTQCPLDCRKGLDFIKITIKWLLEGFH